MRSIACIFLAGLVFAGCQNSQQQQQIKELSARDSALMQKTQEKDSAIMAYVSSLNEIEDNIDAIKAQEKMISMEKKPENKNQKAAIIADIRSLNDLIVKNHKDILNLESKLKKSNREDIALRKMVINLKEEITDKENQVSALESKLSNANDSIKRLAAVFNDSLVVIGRQRMEISTMRTHFNTVYYAIGTYKELKKQGVLTKEGTIAGIGGVPTLKDNFNTTYFTSAMLPDLHAIPLYSKFEKMVTTHPSSSYKIKGNGKADYFVITDPGTFWSTGKYLVIIVNEAAKNRNVATIDREPVLPAHAMPLPVSVQDTL